MRILCCGDRNWTDEAFIYDTLVKLSRNTVIIHGACRGADRLAARSARQLGMEVITFPAKWALYGKAAGPIRNQEMLDEGCPDIVYAFHDSLESSKGTAHMVQTAVLYNIPTQLFKH